jgi:hypothetical protein
MENQEFKYKAFISYNHKDSKEAISLHRRIEAYRIPKAVRKTTSPEFPKRIKPVYLDNDESNPGKDLNDVMSGFLNESDSLIVVCSPNSAKSEYVDFEVNTFKDKNRKIIPYIIAGCPSDDPEKNCYPHSLNKKTTGILLEELGRQKALVKVVAGIFDIDFDTFWRRHKRREKERITYWTVAITIIISLFIGVLMYAKYMQYVKEATFNYEKATALIDGGATNKGIAYLTKSIENIGYEPSIQKLNSILIQGSYLILDSIKVNNRLFDSGRFDKNNSYYSTSGSYRLFIKDEKINIEREKDSKVIGNLDLHYQGKIAPIIGFTKDEKIMYLAEPIYNDINQAISNSLIAESIQFRLRVFNAEPFSLIKDIQINGALNDVEISPMGNHVVVTYRKAKEFETTIEAIPLIQPYIKWESIILGNPQKLLFNPNGINIATVLSKSVNDPDEIKIFDIFNSNSKGYTIPLTDKVKYYCYSNDGRRLAVLTSDKELFIYDVPQCVLAFSPLLLTNNLDVTSIEFDISDTKINVKTKESIFTYLLQKTPFELSKIRSTQGVIDKLCCNTNRNIIASAHYVIGNKGYISFDGEKIEPIMYNNKINALIFSPKGNFLAVGTGNLVSESTSGDIYIYRLEGFRDNRDSISLKEIYHTKLDCPISNIVFNKNEDCIAAYTVSGRKDTGVYCFFIDNRKNIMTQQISCNENIRVIEFLNNYELAIGTIDKKVEFWNIKNNKKEGEVNTKYYPVDIENYKNQNIVIASSSNHSSGEICYFDKNGISQWNSPLITKSGIKKLIVIDSKAIIISENNIVSIIDLKTKDQITDDIKVQGIIKNAIVANNCLKVLSHYSDPAHDFNLKGTEQYSYNHGQQSSIQTFDIETGEELGEPLVFNDDVIDLATYKNDLLYYTSNYLVSNMLSSISLNLDVKLLSKIATGIAGCRISSYGVIEPVNGSLIDKPINNNVEKWFCSSIENRTILPNYNNLIESQLNLLFNDGEYEVLQTLDIYPSYLKAQSGFWFSEAIRIAKENYISNNNAKNVNEHTRAIIDWENYFDTHKTDAVYSDPEARLFADFYTNLIVRQHPNDIHAINERATFYQHTDKVSEYKSCMDKIENITLNNLNLK